MNAARFHSDLVNSTANRASGGKLILLVFVLTILEGAIRKWVFPGPNPLRYLAYFSKDIVLVIAGIAGAARAGLQFRARAKWVLGISALLIVPFAILNLGNSNPIGAILSLRAYVILPVCAYLAAGTINSWRDIDRILATLCILSLLVALLGLVQFRLPPDHWLNRYDLAEAKVWGDVGAVRVTGTFSYITGMANMAAFAGWVGACFFLTGGGIRRGLGIAAAVSGLICGLACMSRTGVIPWLLVLAVSTLCFGERKELVYVLVLGAVGIWVIGNTEHDNRAAPTVYDAAMKRFDHSDTVWGRIEYYIDDFTYAIDVAPVGIGLGLGQFGGYEAEGIRPDQHYSEGEFGRIIMEVGIVGFVAVLGIRIKAIWMVGAQLLARPDRRLLAVCCASFPYLMTANLLGPAFGHTISSFFWGIVAIVAGAIRLDNEVA